MSLATVAGTRAVLSPHGTDPLIGLLTITHDDLAATLRYAAYPEDVVSNSNTFTALNMQIELPSVGPQIPQGTVRVFDRLGTIWQQIEALDSPPTLRLSVVLASDPDTIEGDYQLLKPRSVNIQGGRIEATISHEVYGNEPYPSLRLTPGRAPWLHR